MIWQYILIFYKDFVNILLTSRSCNCFSLVAISQYVRDVNEYEYEPNRFVLYIYIYMKTKLFILLHYAIYICLELAGDVTQIQKLVVMFCSAPHVNVICYFSHFFPVHSTLNCSFWPLKFNIRAVVYFQVSYHRPCFLISECRGQLWLQQQWPVPLPSLHGWLV